MNKLQEYIHNLGNFGVVQSEVTSTLFALLHFSRMDILKAKSCALDVLRLYGHKICHNTSLVCLSIVGLLYLDPVPEEARKIFATAKKLSTSLQTIPFIYLSAKCISYASRRIGNLPETDADLRDISLLRSKLNDTNLASIELLRRLEDSYTPS